MKENTNLIRRAFILPPSAFILALGGTDIGYNLSEVIF